MRVLGERGYHGARVDDVVQAAEVSHGTFYLYFANMEDLVRTLAGVCADDMTALTRSLGPVDRAAPGVVELRRWVADFIALYRQHGVVIRAWMEDQITSHDLSRLGIRTFGAMTAAIVERMTAATQIGPREAQLRAAALIAMIERFTYFATSRDLDFDPDVTAATLAVVIHRGFFAGEH